LENLIERAVVLNAGAKIEIDDLPGEFTNKQEELDIERFIPLGTPLQGTLEEIEEKLIRRALDRCNNVQAHAAEMLGITKSLIQHKLKKYHITL
jgi:two-component system NtrC family response regulator